MTFYDYSIRIISIHVFMYREIKRRDYLCLFLFCRLITGFYYKAESNIDLKEWLKNILDI